MLNEQESATNHDLLTQITREIHEIKSWVKLLRKRYHDQANFVTGMQNNFSKVESAAASVRETVERLQSLMIGDMKSDTSQGIKARMVAIERLVIEHDKHNERAFDEIRRDFKEKLIILEDALCDRVSSLEHREENFKKNVFGLWGAMITGSVGIIVALIKAFAHTP